MWPSGNRPLGNNDSRTNSGNVNNSSRERTNLVPLYAKSIHQHMFSIRRHDSPFLQSDINLPKVHGDCLIGADISNRVDRRSTLLHLGDNTRRSTSGGHDE
jgi:hypothetical protein